MKLVIDIPVREYKHIKDLHRLRFDTDIEKIIAKGKPFSTVLAEMKAEIITRERVEDTSNNQFYNFALNDVLEIINEY